MLLLTLNQVVSPSKPCHDYFVDNLALIIMYLFFSNNQSIFYYSFLSSKSRALISMPTSDPDPLDRCLFNGCAGDEDDGG